MVGEKERFMILKLSKEQNNKLWDIRSILYDIQREYSKKEYLTFLDYLKTVVRVEEIACKKEEVKS